MPDDQAANTAGIEEIGDFGRQLIRVAWGHTKRGMQTTPSDMKAGTKADVMEIARNATIQGVRACGETMKFEHERGKTIKKTMKDCQSRWEVILSSGFISDRLLPC